MTCVSRSLLFYITTAADEGQAAVCALSAEVEAASTSADKARYFASAAADADLPPAEASKDPPMVRRVSRPQNVTKG